LQRRSGKTSRLFGRLRLPGSGSAGYLRDATGSRVSGPRADTSSDYAATAVDRALQLNEIMLREFWDENEGGFFYTGKSQEQLISRAKPIFDASIPSGNAMATQLLLRLHHITGQEDYRARAEKVLRSYYDVMENQPFGFAHMLCAVDQYLNPPKEIVVVGNADDPRTKALLAEVHRIYLPNKVLQLVGAEQALEDISPLLRGKTQVNGQPTAYLCQNFPCPAPVTNPAELKSLLQS